LQGFGNFSFPFNTSLPKIQVWLQSGYNACLRDLIGEPERAFDRHFLQSFGPDFKAISAGALAPLKVTSAGLFKK